MARIRRQLQAFRHSIQTKHTRARIKPRISHGNLGHAFLLEQTKRAIWHANVHLWREQVLRSQE